MGFQLAQLFVDIKARDQAFQGQLAETRRSLSAWGVAAGTAVGTLAAGAISSATSAIARFLTDGVKGAVGLQEAMNRVKIVFGDSAGTITGFAEEVNAKFGVASKQTLIDYSVRFGQVFKVAGESAGEAAKLGTQIAKLGLDLASFYEANPEEVFTALSAALRGEYDPLERFGAQLKAEEVSLHAVSMGLAKNKDDVSNLAKAHATLDMVLKATTDQQGDLERNAGSTSIQWRRLTGTVSEMAIQLGSKLEPALNSLLKAGNGLVDSLSPAIKWLGEMFGWFSDSVRTTVDVVSILWQSLGDAWDITVLKAEEMFLNLTEILSVLPENVGIIAGYVGRNWYNALRDAFNLTGTVFTNFEDNLYRFYQAVGESMGAFGEALWKFLENPFEGFQFDFSSVLQDFSWTPLAEGFEATMETLPELMRPALTDMSGEIDEIGRRIGDRATEWAKAPTKAAPKKGDGSAPDDAKKFTANRYDAAEYTYKLSASILGGDDTAKKQLAAQEKIAKNTDETAKAVKRPRAAVLG